MTAKASPGPRIVRPAPGETALGAMARARAEDASQGREAGALVSVAEVALVQRGERPVPVEVDPAAAGAFFSGWIGAETSECLAVLAIGNRGEPLACEIVARGGIGEVSIDPRTIFRSALMAGASSLWLSHNHPSGDPTPSSADLAATVALVAASQLIGISLHDHIVCTASGRWESIREALNAGKLPKHAEPEPDPSPAPEPAPSNRCRHCRGELIAISPTALAVMRATQPDFLAVRERGYCSAACAERADAKGNR